MPRTGQFVLLRHETPAGYPRGLHWDFMIEVDGALRTWALAEFPTDGRVIDAEALADHRIAYLEFEGQISGGRGAVTRCDRGTFATISQIEDELFLDLRGEQLIGRVSLIQDRQSIAPKTSEPGAAQRWKFRFTSGRSAIGSPKGRGVGLGE
ncbi:MAG TPA: DNA polymerase ligase N-terminal domain-containing protein [Pirellulales bacterium]|jgi:hypothetical protein